MGVDLSGSNISVTEKALNGAQVGAIHEKVGGKTMTKSVRGDMFGDASKTGIFLNDTLNRARTKSTKISRGVRNILI